MKKILISALALSSFYLKTSCADASSAPSASAASADSLARATQEDQFKQQLQEELRKTGDYERQCALSDRRHSEPWSRELLESVQNVYGSTRKARQKRTDASRLIAQGAKEINRRKQNIKEAQTLFAQAEPGPKGDQLIYLAAALLKKANQAPVYFEGPYSDDK